MKNFLVLPSKIITVVIAVAVITLLALTLNVWLSSNGRTNRLPTATEVFNLRSKCAELGQKLYDKTVKCSDLHSSEQRNFPECSDFLGTNYEPGTNYCYVELRTTSPVTIEDKKSERIDHDLYDGQTGALLPKLWYGQELIR